MINMVPGLFAEPLLRKNLFLYLYMICTGSLDPFGGGRVVRRCCVSCITDRHSGSVVERPLCDREVAGSIPCRVIPKTLKMVLAALSLGAQH